MYHYLAYSPLFDQLERGQGVPFYKIKYRVLEPENDEGFKIEIRATKEEPSKIILPGQRGFK